MLATINSIKHYVQQTETSVASGAIFELVLVNATAAPATATTADVKQGAVVKAIYCELWIASQAVSDVTSFNITIEKKVGIPTAMTFAQSQNLGAYPNKKNILYTTQGIVSAFAVGPTIPIMRAWVKIPKGKQRFGFEDELVLNIGNVGNALQLCGIFIFKEYY